VRITERAQTGGAESSAISAAGLLFDAAEIDSASRGMSVLPAKRNLVTDSDMFNDATPQTNLCANIFFVINCVIHYFIRRARALK
jgi:hypothetical protein